MSLEEVEQKLDVVCGEIANVHVESRTQAIALDALRMLREEIANANEQRRLALRQYACAIVGGIVASGDGPNWTNEGVFEYAGQLLLAENEAMKEFESE